MKKSLHLADAFSGFVDEDFSLDWLNFLDDAPTLGTAQQQSPMPPLGCSPTPTASLPMILLRRILLYGQSLRSGM